jgi:hypothetical protein
MHNTAPHEDPVQELRRLAGILWHGGQLPPSQSTSVLRPSIARMSWHWISLALGFFLLAALGNHVFAGVRLVIWTGLGILLLGFFAITYKILATISNSNRYFLLTTPRGFCEADGGSEENPRLTIVPWSKVTKYKRDKKTKDGVTRDRIVLTLAEPVTFFQEKSKNRTTQEDSTALALRKLEAELFSKEMVFEHVIYQGGLEEVDATLQRFLRQGSRVVPEYKHRFE